MNDLITAEEAAEICGVKVNLFRSSRKGVSAPEPVVNKRVKDKTTGRLLANVVQYSRKQYQVWASKNNFWELAADYRQYQRHGSYARQRRRRGTVIDAVPQKQDGLSPVLKLFLQGKFAPEPVLVRQEIKLVRARLRKPVTIRIQVNMESEW